MKIVPKISDTDIIQTPAIQKYMHGTFEIQMLDLDIQKSLRNCIQLMNNQGHLEEVILHMPLSKHVFEVYMMSHTLEHSLVLFLVDCIKYSESRNIKIGLVFHAELNPEFCNAADGQTFLRYILSIIKGTKVYVLLENSLGTLTVSNIKTLPFAKMIEFIDDEAVKICLDICHLQALEYCAKGEIVLPESVINRIHEIHFSATLDNDGYLNKKATHGRAHLNYDDLVKDLMRIVDMGVDLDQLIITAEICENDYRCRPDMLQELAWLYRAQNEIPQLQLAS